MTAIKITAIQMHKTENAMASKKVRRMLFGLNLHTWEQWMLGSLALAGIAAVVVFITTSSVVILQRAEAERALENAAELRKQTAEANERAALASARAEEAQLELAKFRAPRMLNSKQKAELIAKLSPYQGTICLGYVQMFPEPISLYLALEAALSEAGWNVFAPNAPAPTANIVGKQVGMAISRGIQIRFDERDPSVAAAGHALSLAMNDVGITHEMDNSEVSHPGAISLQVGEKK